MAHYQYANAEDLVWATCSLDIQGDGVANLSGRNLSYIYIVSIASHLKACLVVLCT